VPLARYRSANSTTTPAAHGLNRATAVHGHNQQPAKSLKNT
jgi:hypothetical protein